MPAPVATRTRLAPSSASLTERRVSAVARSVPRGARPGGRDRRRLVEDARERFDKDVVVGRIANGRANRPGIGPDDEPLPK